MRLVPAAARRVGPARRARAPLPAVVLGGAGAAARRRRSPSGCRGGGCCWRRTSRGLAWMLALAFVDGSHGIGDDPRRPRTSTSAPPARYDDLHATAAGVRRPDPATTRAATTGRPTSPATRRARCCSSSVLVRLGLGGGFAAGLVVTVLAATTAVAVLVTLRALGAERLARRAAPFLVLGPAAVWQCRLGRRDVRRRRGLGPRRLALGARDRGAALGAGRCSPGCCSADARDDVLRPAAAGAARARGARRRAVAGGRCRSRRVAALAVVLAFAAVRLRAGGRPTRCCTTATGTGIARDRPAAYWMWGDLAALALRRPAAGRRAGAGWSPRARCCATGDPGGAAAGRRRRSRRSLLADLSPDEQGRGGADLAAVRAVAAARRCALLPERWRRPALAVQVVVGAGRAAPALHRAGEPAQPLSRSGAVANSRQPLARARISRGEAELARAPAPGEATTCRTSPSR